MVGRSVRLPAGQRVEELIATLKFPSPILVTQALLPPLPAYVRELEQIWASRRLTNQGEYHEALERALEEFLGAPHCSLFCNGTIALVVALHALGLRGEVITTPFTFPATVQALHWTGLTPVFCDIEADTFNLNPAQVEGLLTPRTAAILPVHVYGNPCAVDELAAVAQRGGVPVVYDAAHAFGATYRGRALAAYGDMAMLSLHATKLFSTVEGGALVVRHEGLKRRIDQFKNFGIVDEDTVRGPGINGKLNELQAAFGLLQLGSVPKEMARRQRIAEVYRKRLAPVAGLGLPGEILGLERNHAYYPIVVDAAAYGMSRDELYVTLKRFNVFTRRYFYPLVTHDPAYRSAPSAAAERLPIAERMAQSVLCLPMYGELRLEAADRIGEIVAALGGSRT